VQTSDKRPLSLKPKTMKTEKNHDWQFVAVQTVIGLIGAYAILFCVAVAFS